MRGISIANQPSSRANERRARARRLFKEALRIDPTNVSALNALAMTHVHEILCLAASRPGEQLRVAEEAVAKARTLAPPSADAHYCRGMVQFAAGAPERALREREIALGFDRTHAAAHAWAGWTKIFLGRADDTEAHVIEAMSLVPRDPRIANWHNFLGVANFCLGRIDQAIEHERRAVEINPHYFVGHLFLTAALGSAGRERAAAEAAVGCLRQNPLFTVAQFRSHPRSTDPRYLARHERLVEGLRLSGIPDWRGRASISSRNRFGRRPLPTAAERNHRAAEPTLTAPDLARLRFLKHGGATLGSVE